jgi:hypoxia up-regulated 1
MTLKALLLSLLCLSATTLSLANVIGIDLGSENMKIGLVSPGKFDIVTNFQSKRKTPLSLTFYRGERMFGSDSTALMSRKPELTFDKLLRMLGKPHDHQHIHALTEQYFPNRMVYNETTGVAALQLNEDTLYSPQELLGMLLQHAKDITKDYSNGQSIKDCVITVPSSFTQHERRALYDAAALVDLKILSLIEENTAAALHFGIDRVFEEPHNVLFYNMGAGSTQVTIAQYSSLVVKEAGKNKTVGQFQVLGKAWDENLGGFNFDLVITEMLADRFNEIWNKKKSGAGKDIRDHIRPMTKLRVEATKLREILSANQEMSYKAEQLHADTDMYTKVTRAEFEDASSDLFNRVTMPIDKALAVAGLTLDDIHAVELLGGGVRMPRVKQELENYFKEGDLELGVHLNGDEAMALGAAFRAANISTAFRVRKVGVSDMSMFGITVELQGIPPTAAENGSGLSSWLKPLSWLKAKENEKTGSDGTADSESEDEIWSKHTSLFPPRTAIPAKIKTVAFQHTEDVLCRLTYDDTDEIPFLPGIDRTIGVFNISGISEFSKEVADKGLGEPKIHLSFTLDASGMVSITKAEASVDLPVSEPESSTDDDGMPESAQTEDNEENNGDDNSSTKGVEDSDNNNESQDSDESEENAASTESESTTESDAEAKTKTNGDDSKKKKSKSDKKKSKKSKKEKAETQIKRTLVVEQDFSATNPPAMTKSQLQSSRQKLIRLKKADEARKAKETALNELETYVYAVRNRLREEDGKDQLGGVSTEEQREEIIAKCDEVEEWLYDDGRNAELTEFKDKESEIKGPADKIFKRFKESIDRPKAVKRALKQLQNVTKKIDTWSTKMPHITEEEIAKLRELISSTENWIASKVEAQEAADPTEDFVFMAFEVVSEMKPVTAMFEKLLRKPKPVPPKPNVTEANNTNSTEDGEPETVFIDLNADEAKTEESADSDGEMEEEGQDATSDEL